MCIIVYNCVHQSCRTGPPSDRGSDYTMGSLDFVLTARTRSSTSQTWFIYDSHSFAICPSFPLATSHLNLEYICMAEVMDLSSNTELGVCFPGESWKSFRSSFDSAGKFNISWSSYVVNRNVWSNILSNASSNVLWQVMTRL